MLVKDPCRSDFRVAILCALPVEADAVQHTFDTFFSDRGKAPGDSNSYTCGTISKYNVVLVHMPGIGPTIASAVVTNLYHTFPAIKLSIVAGICGGVPRPSYQRPQQHDSDAANSASQSSLANQGDVFLGDLVVSTAVVQYDFGRQTPAGLTRRRGPEDLEGALSPEMRTFLTRVQSGHHLEKLRHELHQTMRCINDKDPSSTYPSRVPDCLYQPQYLHKHHKETKGYQCTICNSGDVSICDEALRTSCQVLGCSETETVHRGRLNREPGSEFETTTSSGQLHQPGIHFGTVGSGSAVIRSGRHRDSVAELDDIIAFEMEGAGVWSCVPSALVIKGVADYADSHKNKSWHVYAASVAAAGVKSLLNAWPAELSTLEESSGTATLQRKHPRHDSAVDMAGLQKDCNEHWLVPRAPSANFTGRTTALLDLVDVLTAWLRSGFDRESCCVTISGMGGQGKSELCLKIAHILRSCFWGIFWVDVSSPNTAEQGYIAISRRLGSPTSDWLEAKMYLENTSGASLIILDNADDPDHDYEQYMPSGQRSCVIITSRNPECEALSTASHLDLEGLEDIDAQELLLRSARIPQRQWSSLRKKAATICGLLTNHTLALVQAGTYVGQKHCSLDEYPKAFETRRSQLLRHYPRQARSRYSHVYATFEASVASLSSLQHDDARQLLAFLSTLGSAPFLVPFFRATWHGARELLAKSRDNHVLQSLGRWHIDNLLTVIDTHEEEWDPFRLLGAINDLKSVALISEVQVNNDIGVQIHPLVRAWARDRQDDTMRHGSWTATLCMVALACETDNIGAQYYQYLQPHLVSLLTGEINLIFSGRPLIAVTQALISLGTCLKDSRADEFLLNFLQRLFSHLGLDEWQPCYDWLPLYNLFATSLRIVGQRQQAIAILEHAVALREINDSSEKTKFRMQLRYNLGRTYLEHGHFDAAVIQLEQVVEFHKGDDAQDPLRLSSEFMLALTYLNDRRLDRALELLTYVHNTRKQILREDDHVLLESQQALARAQIAHGRPDAGLALMTHVSNIRNQKLSDSHPDRLNTRHVLAMAYVEANRPAKATTILEDVIRMDEENQTISKQGRLATVETLAWAYMHNSQPEKAVELLKTYLGSKHERVICDETDRQELMQWLEDAMGELGDCDVDGKLSQEVDDMTVEEEGEGL